MSRQVIQASIIVFALIGADASALGLGGLRTESALNQPFAGEITLFDVKPDELDTVKATLATADAFAKSGIERYHFLTQLAFRTEMSARGGAVIRITSREPIREPFMDFLVEVVWPAGQLVKEFTVLLDPPSISERRAPALRPPVIADPRPAPPPSASRTTPRSGAAQQRSASADRPSSSPVQRVPSGPDGFPLYLGPVRPGTGLLRLARAGQPTGATTAQTALALYRNNQDAFIDGDIDRLIAGKTLVIPTSAELFSLDEAAAARELQAALQGESVRRTPMTEVARTEAAAMAEGARLRIAGAAAGAVPGTVEVPSAESAEDTIDDGAAPPSPGTDLEQELLLVMEASETARQETAELRGRIRELETQLADIQTLLQLRNAELARLQSGPSGESTTTEAAGPEVSGPEAESSPILAETAGVGIPAPGASPEDVAEVVAADSSEAAPAVDPAGSEHAPAPAAEPRVAEAEGDPSPVTEVEKTEAVPAVEPEPEPGATSTWHAYLLPLAGFAGVTALGVIGFSLVSARRRRRELEGEDEWSIDSDVVELQAPETPASEPSASVAARLSGDGGVARQSESAPAPASKALQPEIDAGLSPPSSQLASLGHFETETDEADALSEADIYIAYGRYKEAEELLKRELKRSPERLDVRFKLAEVYAGSENPEALHKLMKQLKAFGADTTEPARWRRLSAIAAMVEQGGTWDPGATLPITEATGAPGGDTGFGLDALQGSADAFLGGQVRDDGDDFFRLDISDLESKPRPSSVPTASLAVETPSHATADEELPLLFDDSALDSPPDLPDLSGLADLPAHADQGRQGDLPAGADLILTLDDLRDSRDLNLDALLDAGSRPLTLPAGEAEESPLRLDLPAIDHESSAPAAARREPPQDALRSDDDSLSGQWAMDSGIWDENATKLDLARAYIDMDDVASAREILQEVIADGREEQRSEARDLLRTLA